LKLDQEYNASQVQFEREILSQLEPTHMSKQLELRKQQLEEVAQIVTLYTNTEMLQKLRSSMNGDANPITPEEELANYQKKLEEEKRKREETIQQERAQYEQQMRSNLSKLQETYVQEEKAANDEFERKKQLITKQKEDFMKKQQGDIEQLDHLEKQRIVSNFEKEHQANIAALNQDRLQKKAKLADRLNRRRSTVTPVSGLGGFEGGNAILSPRQDPSAELMSSSEAVTQQQQQAMQRKASTNKMVHKVASVRTLPTVAEMAAATTPVVATMPPALTQSIQLMESKLEKIEKIIGALEKAQTQTKQETDQRIATAVNAAASAAANAAVSAMVQHQAEQTSSSSGEPAAAPVTLPAPMITPAIAATLPPIYHDRDEPPTGEKLEVVHDLDMSVQERARLDFGKRIAHLLGLKTLGIQAASTLPPPAMIANNAFAHSYHYNPDEHCLYVHQQRLATSGDFGTVVIHALSHIKVNPTDLSNDYDPKFLSEFYKNLKILSQDLYKKSAVASTTTFTKNANNNGLTASGSVELLPPNNANVRPSGNTPGTGGNRGAMKRQLSRNSFNSSGSNLLTSSLEGKLPNNTSLLLDALGEEDESSIGPGAGGFTPNAHGHHVPPSPRENAFQQHPTNYFTNDALMERMKLYAQQGGIPLDYIDRYMGTNNK